MTNTNTALLTLAITLCTTAWAGQGENDPPEIALGERLFLETRFAQAYAENPGRGDPVMATTQTLAQALPGPFAGRHMNCRACHLVDEQADAPGGGIRSYADFARLSPQPVRRQDATASRPRNAQTLINSALPRDPGTLFHPLLHHDGQFATLEDLVATTFTGREFGWLPGEETAARAHIARVIRQDDGRGDLAQEFGGAYRTVLKGTDPAIPEALRLPPEYRLDVASATDETILAAVARLVAAYVADLRFAQDDAGHFTASPYDHFLALNSLPRAPRPDESPRDYSHRLLVAVEALEKPRFVTAEDHAFASHEQPFVFGPQELTGLTRFFGAANCTACHPAPNFTDFSFHNTGATQAAYDRLHGDGAFAGLDIPDLKTRAARHDAYLPATEQHPRASERFRALAAKDKPGYTDLGLWNIFANPDFPNPQPTLRALLCEPGGQSCDAASLLPQTIARFKTPGLRDLGHSAPYLHDGSQDRIEDVIAFYLRSAQLARAGKLRNGAEELQSIDMGSEDMAALTAFLKALNEDYE